MKQSTLVFGRGGTSTGSNILQKDLVEGEVENGPPPLKRTRRSAASKSEEKSRRQMQMTFDLNGELHSVDREEQSQPRDKDFIVIDDDDDNVRDDTNGKMKKKDGKSIPSTSTTTPATPILLSVKGNQTDSTTVHSFFAKRKVQPVQIQEKESLTPAIVAAPSTMKKKFPLQRDAPWPDADSIHVQPDDEGRQSIEEGPRSLYSRRIPRSPSPGDYEPSHFWKLVDINSSSPSNTEGHRSVTGTREEIIPPFMKDSIDLDSCLQAGSLPAAVSRLHNEAAKGTTSSNYGLWVDVWRPTRAEDVLGNEKSSLYLRDWLEELRVVSSTTNLNDVKRVERRKKKVKKGALDDFIVDDEEEEQAWFDQFRKYDSSETEMDIGSPSASFNGNHTEGRHLSNAVVLCGPTGSGKTASVYACAAELGFEVFELYAGVGKRSGKEVSQAVGDLGRNHMVSSGGVGGGATWKGSMAGTKAAIGAPRQSLILLEEVDLLFEEDKGFWPAVIELISTSRRPVVMTCNDLSSIPLDELPIQDVLQFEPPSESQAVAYMQLMALCQGHLLSQDSVKRVYHDTMGDSQLRLDTSRLSVPADGPLHPSTMLASIEKCQGDNSSCDLRQAIMQLQCFCQCRANSKTGGGEEGKTTFILNSLSDVVKEEVKIEKTVASLKEEISLAELQSYCDANLSLPFHRACEIIEPDGYESSINDVQCQGTSMLFKPRVKMEEIMLLSAGREVEYYQALSGPGGNKTLTFEQFDKDRIRESARISKMLTCLFINPSSRVPSLESVLDYAPIIGNMIQADDDEEAAHLTRITQVLQEAQQTERFPGWESASASLMKIGIRPSRHSARLLLERGADGIMALGRREAHFHRWISIDESILKAARQSRLDLT